MTSSEVQDRLNNGDEVIEARLKWFGHVQRREDGGYIDRGMLEMLLLG